jgi:hypothetical protein
MKWLMIFMPVLFLSCSGPTENSSEGYKSIVEPQLHKADPSVIVGSYCGECSGTCFYAYMADEKRAYKHTSRWIPTDGKYFWMSLPDSMYPKVKAMLQAIPNNLGMYKSPIGDPDSHDQCGIYILYHDGMQTKELKVDPDQDQHPREFDEFFERMGKLY